MKKACKTKHQLLLETSSSNFLTTELNEHIAQCPDCQELLEVHIAALQVGQEIQRKRERELFLPPALTLQRLQHRLNTPPTPRRVAFRFPILARFGTVLASAAIVLFAWWGLQQVDPGHDVGKSRPLPIAKKTHNKPVNTTPSHSDPFQTQEEPSALDEALVRLQAQLPVDSDETQNDLNFYSTWTASLSKEMQSSMLDDPAPISMKIPIVSFLFAGNSNEQDDQ